MRIFVKKTRRVCEPRRVFLHNWHTVIFPWIAFKFCFLISACTGNFRPDRCVMFLWLLVLTFCRRRTVLSTDGANICHFHNPLMPFKKRLILQKIILGVGLHHIT